MHKRINIAIDYLNKIAAQLKTMPAQSQVLSEAYGWNITPVSAEQLSFIALSLVTQLSIDAPDELNDQEDDRFIHVNRTLKTILQHVLPNASSNFGAAGPAIFDGLIAVQTTLGPYLGWTNSSKNRLPAALMRKLNAIDRDLELMMPDKDAIGRQLSDIRDAHAAAETLPTTLAELKRTQADVNQISASASESIGRITQAEQQALGTAIELRDVALEGQTLVDRAAEAYRITTTIGLGAAFDERARKLNQSLYIWVGGLATSLITLLCIGAWRLENIKDALAVDPFEWGRVWVQLVISILSVGAPIWFAWISTKQIAQRFRLAEDYAFKASVAKAYEGYRREAAALSDEFTHSLFAAALKRLDEPPLRLLEMGTHGSPVHELISSKLFERRSTKPQSAVESRSPASGRSKTQDVTALDDE